MTLSKLKVKEKLLKAKTILKQLTEDAEMEYSFKTANKYIPGFGTPGEIYTKEGLIKLYAHLNKDNSELENAAKELGVELDKDNTKIQGYSKKIWIDEIKRQIRILDRNNNISNLKNIIDVLTNNLSEDDKFSLDMESIADGLNILD